MLDVTKWFEKEIAGNRIFKGKVQQKGWICIAIAKIACVVKAKF